MAIKAKRNIIILVNGTRSLNTSEDKYSVQIDEKRR